MQQLYMQEGKKMSKQTILHVGLALIDQLKVVHMAGYVFNDLKLENILL